MVLGQGSVAKESLDSFLSKASKRQLKKADLKDELE